jgi:hypothetical protein
MDPKHRGCGTLARMLSQKPMGKPPNIRVNKIAINILHSWTSASHHRKNRFTWWINAKQMKQGPCFSSASYHRKNRFNRWINAKQMKQGPCFSSASCSALQAISRLAISHLDVIIQQFSLPLLRLLIAIGTPKDGPNVHTSQILL